MRIEGIQHVNLNVQDLERSRRFYEEVLGFQTAFAKGTTVWLEAGGDLLGLSQGEPPAENPNHWGFRMNSPEDVDAWARRLADHDVKIEKGPYTRSSPVFMRLSMDFRMVPPIPQSAGVL